MSEWSGEERRGLSHDWIERDRLLSEVHSDMKHMVDWAKAHDQADNNRFELMGRRVTWIEKLAYTGIGGMAVLEIFLKLLK